MAISCSLIRWFRRTPHPPRPGLAACAGLPADGSHAFFSLLIPGCGRRRSCINEGKDLAGGRKLGRTGPVLTTYVGVVGPLRVACPQVTQSNDRPASEETRRAYPLGTIPQTDRQPASIKEVAGRRLAPGISPSVAPQS